MIPIANRFCIPLPYELPEAASSENQVSQMALSILGPKESSSRLEAGEPRASVNNSSSQIQPKLDQRVAVPRLKPLFSPAVRLRFNIRLPQGDMLPDDAPRGIKDGGEGGWLNATLQLLESSIPMTQWLKESHSPLLSIFGKFFTAYHGRKILNSEPIRAALSQHFSMGKKGTDPCDLLAFILDQSPPELKANVSKSVFYNNPLNADTANFEIKESESPIITLPLRGTAPHLEKMLHDYQHERPIGLKRTEMGVNGKPQIYRAKKIERRFISAPPELWFRISRFEHVVQQSIFNEVPYLKWIFPPIKKGVSKNSTPVWIPQEIEIRPLEGSPKIYRLNAFLVHEGASPQENRVKAYRFKDNVLYGCHNQWIVKISSQSQQEILSQAYLLHYEPLD